MVQLPQNVDLIQQHFRVSDHSLVDDLDDPVGEGRLLQFSLEDCPVASSTDGLS
jgi:hypothetical protein